MSSAPFRVRRAAVDDLPALRQLWESMRLQVSDLERRLTEFQVVEDASGKVIGTLGFCIQQRHGLIHSEAFSDFSAADEIRPLFWTRIQSLVLNHGLARLWTRENSPFWTRNGFLVPEASALEKFPGAWAAAGNNLLTLRIKDEDAVVTVEQEINAWMETERQRMAQRMEKTKTLKTVALSIVALVCLAFLAATLYVMVKNPNIKLPWSGRH